MARYLVAGTAHQYSNRRFPDRYVAEDAQIPLNSKCVQPWLKDTILACDLTRGAIPALNHAHSCTYS